MAAERLLLIRGGRSGMREFAGLRSHGTVVAVWTIWSGMLLAALLLVIYYGSNVPSWDDWDMIPTLTGNQPVTLLLALVAAQRASCASPANNLLGREPFHRL